MLRISSKSIQSFRKLRAAQCAYYKSPLKSSLRALCISSKFLNIKAFANKPQNLTGFQKKEESIKLETSACSPVPPPPPPPLQPSVSATVLIHGLRKSNIEISMAGYKIIKQSLRYLPFQGVIDTQWISTVAKELQNFAFKVDSNGNGQMGKGVRLDTLVAMSPAQQKVETQIDRLCERMLAHPDWGHVYYEPLLTESGLRVGGEGEIRKIMEVLLRNEWVEPLEDEETIHEVLMREWAP